MKPQDPKRFDLIEGLVTMKAVVTTGHGGYEQLVYRDVPVPVPGPGEVLLQVLASSVNNTDINTRLGWYSAAVTTATQDAATARAPTAAAAWWPWRRVATRA